MKTLVISTVPHADQRYETPGDYQETPGATVFSISRLADSRYEKLIALHEIVEYFLCDHRGISMDAIDAFDMAFERDRDPGDESEPGHHPKAPYRREHQFAEKVERLLAKELGVDWKTYDQTVMELHQ